MSIVSLSFALFVLILLAIYYLIPKKIQWICLLCGSIFFYACNGIKNLAFIFITSISVFFAARLICIFSSKLKEKKQVLSKEDFKTEKQKTLHKKRIVLVSLLAFNIGILIYLKYWLVLTHAKNLFLPLGISYYTLQCIGYFMDVYWEKYKNENNFFKFFLFVSFFPQLTMGPINRYDDTGKQLISEHNFNFENIKKGLYTILYGAFKKYLIADMLYGKISSILDQDYHNLSGIIVIFGILMYAIYQYADFSGGINIVLGVAKLFGINMKPNFNRPYFATSLANFWQRWHMSLGAWMRDYVFYPFALTKAMHKLSTTFTKHFGRHIGSTIPACIANILVFSIVGAWHGPELHFLIWGLYNGLVIAFSDLLSPFFKKINRLLHIDEKAKWFQIFRIVRTFFIVNIGWYFDRIVDVKKSFIYLKNTFTNFGSISMLSREYLISILGNISYFESQIILVLIGSITVFFVSVLKERNVDIYAKIDSKPLLVKYFIASIPLLLTIISFSFNAGDAGFMYAQY